MNEQPNRAFTSYYCADGSMARLPGCHCCFYPEFKVERLEKATGPWVRDLCAEHAVELAAALVRNS